MFTREQIREISKRLSELGIKDTDMEETDKISSDDVIAIVQDGVNKKVSVKELISSIGNSVIIE